ncbi:MAG: hypothetical protein MUC87_00780 [Bacteroidia bacterium]|jgi:hypothetical protein|nr:hypothetical protein [Bacteroidia bacterium]
MALVTPDWGLILFMLFTLAGAIAYGVFFLLSLHNALRQCAPATRKMEPGQVWLILIPFFGIVWLFIVVSRMADSLAAEYERRRIPLRETRPGYGVGLAMAIAGCGSLIRNLGKYAEIPVLFWIGIAFALVFIVLTVVYWVQIAGYKNELRRSGNWQQFAHINPHSQPQQSWSSVPQPDLWSHSSQPLNGLQLQPNTPPPTDPNDYSRFMPPGS